MWLGESCQLKSRTMPLLPHWKSCSWCWTMLFLTASDLSLACCRENYDECWVIDSASLGRLWKICIILDISHPFKTFWQFCRFRNYQNTIHLKWGPGLTWLECKGFVGSQKVICSSRSLRMYWNATFGDNNTEVVHHRPSVIIIQSGSPETFGDNNTEGTESCN